MSDEHSPSNQDWPPRFTITADGAARLILLNYQQEQNEAKTVLAITRLLNEAFNEGRKQGATNDRQRNQKLSEAT